MLLLARRCSMEKKLIYIDSIPAIIWGKNSSKVYIYVHGKMGNKEEAAFFADIAEKKGYQTISFDLPKHGERQNRNAPCDIWNGKHDLECIGKYVYDNWNNISLYACSIGVYFSLHAYKDKMFEKCLFLSPILDMNYLIQNMFLWFDVCESELKEKGEIETPIETLSWNYYQFVKNNPVKQWITPTYIMYGYRDTLQSEKVIHQFVKNFNCQLTISKDSEHSFMGDTDRNILQNWIKEYI